MEDSARVEVRDRHRRGHDAVMWHGHEAFGIPFFPHSTTQTPTLRFLPAVHDGKVFSRKQHEKANYSEEITFKL